MKTVTLVNIRVLKDDGWQLRYRRFWQFPENVLLMCGWDFLTSVVAEFVVPDSVDIITDKDGYKFFMYKDIRFYPTSFLNGLGSCELGDCDILLRTDDGVKCCREILKRKETFYLSGKFNRLETTLDEVFKNAPEYGKKDFDTHEQSKHNYPFVSCGFLT